ncbi:MAG: UbiA prenyltransferase family protein [Saprospiraceae bacterium]|nr:UbiA prenyltransferase family protein [Saprospiraceae bacterium]
MTFRQFVHLIRVEHWVKNLFLFLPAFFGARLGEPLIFERTFAGFIAFSLIASSVYVLNDTVDAPHDRQHPDKRKRPVASGEVSRTQAMIIMGALLAAGAGVVAWLSPDALLYCAFYFVINIAYSLSLKHYAIIDISLISMGFILRVLAGGAVAGVEVSNWLQVLTFLLALILIERIGSNNIFYTAFFVIVGILRYLQLTLVFNKTESPTRALLRDRYLQLILLGWIACFVWLLYIKK